MPEYPRGEMRHYVVSMKMVFFIILLGSLTSIVLGVDNVFPFSNYPMYSQVFAPKQTLVQHIAFAEIEGEKPHQIKAGAIIRPFWKASFHEALLVEREPERIKLKMAAALHWMNQRRVKSGKVPYQKLLLYRYEVPWDEWVRRRLQKEELHSLYWENATLLIEVRAEP